MREWHQWHRVVAAGHAPERSWRESMVKELSERGVADSGLTEGRDGRGPTAARKVEARKRRDGSAKRVPDESQCVVGVLFDKVSNDIRDYEVGLAPALKEARVHEAAGALVSGSVVAFGRIRDVLLFDEGEVRERVGDRVGSAESKDDARDSRWVGEGDVAARVGEGEAGIPGLLVGGC